MENSDSGSNIRLDARNILRVTLTSFHDNKVPNIENCPEDVGISDGREGRSGEMQNTELEINLREDREDSSVNRKMPHRASFPRSCWWKVSTVCNSNIGQTLAAPILSTIQHTNTKTALLPALSILVVSTIVQYNTTSSSTFTLGILY